MFSMINAPSLRKHRDACSIVWLPSAPAARSVSDGVILEIMGLIVEREKRIFIVSRKSGDPVKSPT
jgi:hypothetical protein